MAYEDLVRSAYAGIGRTGFGTDLNQIDQQGFDWWMSNLQSGNVTPDTLSASFNKIANEQAATNPAYAQQIQSGYGNLVDQAYGSVGRTGIGTGLNQVDQPGRDFWMDQLQSGNVTPDTLLPTFTGIANQQAATNPAYATQILEQSLPFDVSSRGSIADFVSNSRDLGSDVTRLSDEVSSAEPVNSINQTSQTSSGDIFDEAIANISKINPGVAPHIASSIGSMRAAVARGEDPRPLLQSLYSQAAQLSPMFDDAKIPRGQYDPKMAQIQAYGQALSPVAPDTQWQQNFATANRNQSDFVWRDPSTGRGIAVNLNTRGVPEGFTFVDSTGSPLRSSAFTASDLYRGAEEFGIPLQGVEQIGTMLENAGVSYKPGELYRGTGSTHGVDFSSIARGGMGSAYNWATDPTAVAGDRNLASRLNLNPALSAISGNRAPLTGDFGTREYVVQTPGGMTSWYGTEAEARAAAPNYPGATVGRLQGTPVDVRNPNAASMAARGYTLGDTPASFNYANPRTVGSSTTGNVSSLLKAAIDAASAGSTRRNPLGYTIPNEPVLSGQVPIGGWTYSNAANASPMGLQSLSSGTSGYTPFRAMGLQSLSDYDTFAKGGSVKKYADGGGVEEDEPTRLRRLYGNIGEISKFTPSDEGGGYVSYNANPSLRQTIEGGPGYSNIRPLTFGQNYDPLANEYGVIPSEQTAAPTSYQVDLTTPDKDGWYYTADVSPSGEMIGDPKRVQYKEDWFRKNPNIGFALPLLAAGGAGLGLFGGAGATAGATAAATAAESAAAYAAAAEAGGGSLFSNLTATLSGLPQTIGSTILPSAPGWAQGAVGKLVTNTALNAIATGGDIDFGNVLKSTAFSSLGGFGNTLGSFLAPEGTSDLVKKALGDFVVKTVASGGDVKQALLSVATTGTNPFTSAVNDLTGSAPLTTAAMSALRQAIASGTIDPNRVAADVAKSLINPTANANAKNVSAAQYTPSGTTLSDSLDTGPASTSADTSFVSDDSDILDLNDDLIDDQNTSSEPDRLAVTNSAEAAARPISVSDSSLELLGLSSDSTRDVVGSDFASLTGPFDFGTEADRPISRDDPSLGLLGFNPDVLSRDDPTLGLLGINTDLTTRQLEDNQFLADILRTSPLDDNTHGPLPSAVDPSRNIVDSDSRVQSGDTTYPPGELTDEDVANILETLPGVVDNPWDTNPEGPNITPDKPKDDTTKKDDTKKTDTKTSTDKKDDANNPWLSLLGLLLGAGVGASAARNKGVTPMGLQALNAAAPRAARTQTGARGTKGQGSVNYFTRRAATGGTIGAAAGGPINQGLGYLRSSEDGMADRIDAVIDNRQPAKLSGGEFVIPADVVSHLGNGNSDAGAKQLHAFMTRIRKARTGSPKQGRQINPNKYMPK